MRKRPQSRQHDNGRHEYKCTVCMHPRRSQIEQTFLAWNSPTRIAKKFRVTVDAIYRHAHAANLIDKRRRNVRAALEKIIERASEVSVNAAAVVSAVTALARINAQGRLVEKVETVNLNALFERMSEQELLRYATDGVLPQWFSTTSETAEESSGLIATPLKVPEVQVIEK